MATLQQLPPQQWFVAPAPQVVPSLTDVPVHVPLVQALLILHSTSQFWQKLPEPHCVKLDVTQLELLQHFPAPQQTPPQQASPELQQKLPQHGAPLGQLLPGVQSAC